MTKLKIPKTIQNQLFAHSKALAPIESCGYLAGKDGEITKFYEMTNIDNSPEHFSFDPKEQFAVMKDARNEGLQLISCYHSHPETPARLSEEDIRLFNDPNTVYIIVSLKEEQPYMKGFTIKKSDNDVDINEVELEII